ncbi:lipoyl(octanoyl) transferase LipB [Consotaella aegiceratis]|uniref:lipoyl(octanoyl) transferase LipB n=1 Tax=Consotaella aegiceratis TaxID=3097961 RepID=UPI002F42EB2C
MDAPFSPIERPARLTVSAPTFRPRDPAPPVEWLIWEGLTKYQDALAFMDARATAIHRGEAGEAVLLLEHPPLYTAGTSADVADLVAPDRFPVFKAGRGGEYTYHGPGQRIAYVMLDLKRRRPDIRAFVAALEQWIIATLAEFQVKGERREDRVGVWVQRPERPPSPDGSPAEDKIAAIGIRVRHWVTLHGISLNVDPDLEHFSGIIPCGVRNHGVTSLVDLGLPVTMPEVDGLLRRNFEAVFGPTLDSENLAYAQRP